MSLTPLRVLLACGFACIPLAITGAHAAAAVTGSSGLVPAAAGALVIALGAGLPAAALSAHSRRIEPTRAR